MTGLLNSIKRIVTSNWTIRGLLLITFVAMSISAFYYNVGKHSGVDEGGLWLGLGGLFLLLMLLIVWNRPQTDAQTALIPQEDAPIRTRWLFVIIGIGTLMLLAEINGKSFRIEQLLIVSSHVQFALWLIGIGTVTYGLAGWRYRWVEQQSEDGKVKRIRQPIRGQSIRQRLSAIHRLEILGIAGIILIATVTRVWELEMALRLWIDEIHFSNPVLHFYTNQNIDLLIPFSSVAAFPYIFPYMQWHFVELLGWNLVGLRMLSVVMGVANVFVLYLLARELFNRRVAMFSALMFATFPLHIQFSRLGLNNIADPLFGTLLFYFIIRGIKYPQQMRGNFAWAGAMLGLTQYFYEGGRLLFPALVIGFLGFVAVWSYLRHIRPLMSVNFHNKERWRMAVSALPHINPMPIFRAGVILVVVAVCVGAPVYYTLFTRDYTVAARLNTAGMSELTVQSINAPEDMVWHIIRRLGESWMIHVSIPEAQFYYGGDTSFIIGIIIPFFFIGTFYALWLMCFGGVFGVNNRFVLGSLLMVVWVMLTWGGNSILEESRISARYVVELPALACLIGLGMHLIIEQLRFTNTKLRNYFIAVVLCVIIPLQVVYYFDYHLPLLNVQFRDDRGRNYDVEDALYRSVNFPNGTRIHIIDYPTMYSPDAYNILRFLTRDIKRDLQTHTLKPEDFTDLYVESQPRFADNAFYFVPSDVTNIQRLKDYFGDIVQGPFYTEFPASMDKGFVLYYVPSTRSIIAESAPEG